MNETKNTETMRIQEQIHTEKLKNLIARIEYKLNNDDLSVRQGELLTEYLEGKKLALKEGRIY